MQGRAEHVQRLLEPVVTGLGYELIGVELAQGPGGSILRVYIDRDDGITLDDCERVSHQVSGLLDVEDPIRGQYALEVSSPGLDRPLFTPAHYARFTGETVRLQLSRPLNGRRRFKGRLTEAGDEEIVIEQDGETVRIPFECIEKGRLVP